jgi:hypothetical protein
MAPDGNHVEVQDVSCLWFLIRSRSNTTACIAPQEKSKEEDACERFVPRANR